MRLEVFAQVWIAAWSLATLASGWLYWASYWRWRGCFNEEGRCFVESDAVVHHDSAAILIVLPIACGLATVAGAVLALRSRKLRGMT